MWTCPKCASKVDDNFEVCWNCGTSPDGTEDPSFIKADDSAPIDDPAYDPVAEATPKELGPTAVEEIEGLEGAVVVAYEASTIQEAKFIADQLGAEGIPAMSDTQDLLEAADALDRQRVYVRAHDIDRARAWLAAYEERRKANPRRFLEP